MKTTFSVLFVLVLCMRAAALAATVELVTGPDLSVSYDPLLWKPLAPLRAPQPGTYQSMTWELQRPKSVQITVTSHPEQEDEAQYKKQILSAQNFRGDPAKLIAERKESVAGREFSVLEFVNSNTRPSRREIYYFLPGASGYVSLFIVGNEADLPECREAVEAFLREVHLK